MNDNPPNSRSDDTPGGAMPLDEELVAYLDGELDPESGRRIEALLASDPEVRRRLQSFERTWDLLDELDSAPAGEPFTQTTLEMVAVAARKDVEQDQAEAPRRRRKWLLRVAASLLIAAVAGFVAVAMYDPDRQLLHDLPLLENLEEYHQVRSIEFLHKLRDAKLFCKENVDAIKGEVTEKDDTFARRLRIKNMSLDEKEELLRSKERFANLMTPKQQREVRQLHEDLQKDPDIEQLRVIMHNYYEWLKSLSSLQCVELAELGPGERVALVKKWLQIEQQREDVRRPDRKDMDIVRKWADDCATRREADFVKTLKTEQEKRQFLGMKNDWRHQVMWLRWPSPDPNKLPPMLTDRDMSRLVKKLSPETRKRLETKTPVEQWHLVANWLLQSLHHPDEDRRPHLRLPKDDDERLAEFFEKGISSEERDRLLAMPGEEMQRRLLQMYLTRTKWPEAPTWRPEGPGPRRDRRPDDAESPPPQKPNTAPPSPHK
jgi:hypothetical protein